MKRPKWTSLRQLYDFSYVKLLQRTTYNTMYNKLNSLKELFSVSRMPKAVVSWDLFWAIEMPGKRKKIAKSKNNYFWGIEFAGVRVSVEASIRMRAFVWYELQEDVCKDISEKQSASSSLRRFLFREINFSKTMMNSILFRIF